MNHAHAGVAVEDRHAHRRRGDSGGPVEFRTPVDLDVRIVRLEPLGVFLQILRHDGGVDRELLRAPGVDADNSVPTALVVRATKPSSQL